MTLVKFSPRFESYVPDYFNHVLDELLEHKGNHPEKKYSFIPKADIAESETDYKVYLELAGVDKNDIHISLDENKLTVTGTKAPVYDEKLKLHSHETIDGEFERSFFLSKDVKSDKITATFNQGVLEISIPKEKETPVKRVISVK